MNLFINHETSVFSGPVGINGYKLVTVINQASAMHDPRSWNAETVITDLRGGIVDSFSRSFPEARTATGIAAQMKMRARRVIRTAQL